MTTKELHDRLSRIYNDRLFDYTTGHIEVDETQDKTSLTKHVHIVVKGNCISIDEHFLGNAVNSFNMGSAPKMNIACDKIIITDFRGRKYIVLIELKSGINSGIESTDQLFTSGIKIISELMPIDGFIPDEYKIVSITACQKPTIEYTNKLQKAISTNIELSGKDKLKLQAAKHSLIRGNSISSKKHRHDELPLKDKYKIEDVPFFIYTLPYNSDTGSFELDDVLSAL